MKTKLPSRRWAAYKALYGAQLDLGDVEVLGKPKAPPRPRGCPDEDTEHMLSANWLRKEAIPHHHSPNGERRDRWVGAKLKAMGTSAGFPDFIIPLPGAIKGKPYPCLFIELKALDGRVSDVQKAWLDLLNRNGYYACVAYGYAELKTIVQEYLKECLLWPIQKV